MNFPKNHLFQEDKNIYSLISGQGRGWYKGEKEGDDKKKGGDDLFSSPPSYLKSAATYSPTFTQYHRRGQA